MEFHDTGLSRSARSSLQVVAAPMGVLLPKAATRRAASPVSPQVALWRPTGALRRLDIAPLCLRLRVWHPTRQSAMKTNENPLDGL